MEIFESCNASGGGIALNVLEAKDSYNHYSYYFVNKSIITSPILVGLALWLKIPILNGSISFTEKPVDNAGTAYTSELSVFVPGNEIANVDAFENLNGKRFILDFNDNNNNRRLIGFKNESLMLSISFDVPNSYTGVAGHMLTFSGVVSKRAPKYAI